MVFAIQLDCFVQLAKEAARHPTGPDPARGMEKKADVKLGLE